MYKQFLAGLALILPLLANADFDEGIAAYTGSDYAKAVAELKPLADQGSADAQHYMGLMSHYGYGTAKDQTVAANWFRKAAVQGDPRSQYYLGKMYEAGDGVARSLPDAFMWLSLSAAGSSMSRDSVYTKEDLGKLERRMTPEQVAKAKDMAKQWKPQPK